MTAVTDMEPTGAAFVAAARAYIGVRWRHQGRTRAGLDCIGLVVMAAHDIGLAAPGVADYGRLQDYMQARGYLDRFCRRVGRAEIGDIVLFRNSQSLHMAIVSMVNGTGAPKRVVQALGPGGRVCESGLSFPALQLWRPLAWR